MTAEFELRLERLLRHDRLWVAGAIAALAGASWVAILDMDRAMRPGPGGVARDIWMIAMTPAQAWTAKTVIVTFAMWSVMMVGMMLPSATPAVLLAAGIGRRSQKGAAIPTIVGPFIAGYLAVWILFACVATAADWVLSRLSLVDPMLVLVSRPVAAALLVAAGIYELTPLKRRCLLRCRSPVDLVVGRFPRSGRSAFRLGILNGIDCVGCCWLLMVLLFVGGVMNAVWIGVLSAVVLLQKVLPGEIWIVRATGTVLAAAGVAMLAV